MELLKNHVMKYIQPRTTDVVDKAKEKWNKILNNCKDLPDEDSMLGHFCKCYIKNEQKILIWSINLLKKKSHLKICQDF